MSELSHDQVPENWSAGAAGYESAFAPFTGVYADEAVRLSGITDGSRVLDVAAGSGALSLRAARLGADVLATDFSPGMVELLRTRFAEEGLGGARAEVMDGQALTVEDGTFDAAFSLFGLIFFPDMEAGFRELRRAVRPGGTVCVSTWRLAGFPVVEMIGQAFARTLPDFEPSDDEPTWARIGDADGLAAALGDSGLDGVVVHTVTRGWSLEDPADFFRRLPEWSPPVQPLFAALDAEVVERCAAAFVEVVAENADGPQGVDVDALLGLGIRP